MSTPYNAEAIKKTANRQVRRLRRLWKDPKRTVYNYLGRRIGEPTAPPAATDSIPKQLPASGSLTPAEALAENGFYIYRAQIPPAETSWIAATLKHEASVTDGKKCTNLDAVNRFPSARKVLLDPRVLSAVRQAIGDNARFLQVSDLHYHHDTAAWHRDSPYRAVDNTTAPDWSDMSAPYRVVKAIVYLESENAAMGIMAGSNRTPIEVDLDDVAVKENEQQHIVIRPTDDPNRRLTEAERSRPIIWSAKPGDVLVFDERTYHCGRRFDGGKVWRQGGGRKFTLSFVFGGDDAHSARMFSYFRYVRTELKYLPWRDEKFVGDLEQHGLVHSNGWDNYFVDHPDELRGIWLRDNAQPDELIAKFAAQGATRAAAG